MSWVAWDMLTKSKAEGGLGLRDIQLFNQALLAKIAWRIITVPDCLLARILKGKYCHKQSFLEVEQPSVCSHGWRGILHVRNLLKKNLGKAIGNGLSTRVWRDLWISLDVRNIPYGPIEEEALDLRVFDLLTDDLKWNKQRIERFLPDFADQIQCLQPSLRGVEDRYVWQPLPSGNYTTRSGYHSVANNNQERQRDLPVQEFDWIRDVWKTACSPKMKVFIWSVIQNALPLGENLQRRGINANVNCPRCNEMETSTHIFFTCPFAKRVWECIPLKDTVHLAVDDSFKVMTTRFRSAICLPPTGVSKPIFSWVIWSILKDRNLLVFENKSLTPAEIASKSLNLAREWSNAQDLLPSGQNTKMGQQETSVRNLPPSDPEIVVCKSDAAWDAERHRAGLAWVLRGRQESAVDQGSTIQHFVNSPLIAEALAVREGIFKAASQGISSLWVCSDNRTLIRAINNKNQRKELVGIIEDIHDLSSDFVSIAFFHIGREDNDEADALAKSVFWTSSL